MKKGLAEILKFFLVSCAVGIVHLVLLNVLYFSMQGWTAPLPGFLHGIFSPAVVGEGNDNWGYVLPFLLSNIAANVYGYFRNRKTTFRAENVPRYCLAIYLAVLSALILLSTWLQGVLTGAIVRGGAPWLRPLAPTAAALVTNTMQLIILFPLEKFVLFRDRGKPENG